MKQLRVGVIVVMAVFVVLSVAGCAKPPTKELADARQAFQEAAGSGAETYAQMDYANAQAALNDAEQLMQQRKYTLAREKALEALRLARQAQASAATSKNAANQNAQEMYALALQAVNSANAAGAYTFAEAQMLEAQRTLEDAKRLYDAGDYSAARQVAESALAQAQAAEAAARQARQQQDTQAAQQVAQELRDPGATPRAYPLEHVVIKGETLWWIAEYKQIYDDPFQWPLIYKANRGQIKDPDLIYPDQVFQVTRAPELTEAMVKEAIKFARNRGAWSLYDGK